MHQFDEAWNGPQRIHYMVNVGVQEGWFALGRTFLLSNCLLAIMIEVS